MIDAKPVVSVLIPTFNQVAFLKDAIESALAQTYHNLEIVISDDASLDATSKLVAAYDDSRIKYFRNDNNIGRVKNYRKALYEYATGDWVVNLDGDDYFVYDKFVEEAVEAFNLYPQAIMAFANFYQTDTAHNDSARNPGSGDGLVRLYDGNEFFFSIPKNRIRIQHLSTIYNRKAALELDFYRSDIISSDYESLYRLMINQKIIHINRTVGVWRKHGGNFSSLKDAHQWVANLDLFSSVSAFAKGAINNYSLVRVVFWEMRNFTHYSRRILIRALYSADVKFIFAVLVGIWQKNSLYFLITIVSPLTYLSAIKIAVKKLKYLNIS